MAPVMNPSFSNFATSTRRRYHEYQVEVVFFDGESATEYVFARSEEEAQAKAIAQYPDADYTMVQAVWDN